MSAFDASFPTLEHPIAFIGGGNMARSLIGGLVARGAPSAQVRVADPNAEIREALVRDFGVQTFEQAEDAVAGAATWVLATKPQVLQPVCAALAPLARSARPLVLSIAAGITSAQIDRWLGGDAAVVRTMPNTPALLGAGVTGLYANARVDAGGRKRADALMRSAGTTVWLDDEARMDAVTAVSGSGPAYVFLLAEAMAAAGAKLGLSPELAMRLARHTVAGAGELMIRSDEEPATLRCNVTSPNGTTAAALAVLMEPDGLEPLMQKAIAAAARRAAELSKD